MKVVTFGEIMLRLHQVSNMGGESPFSEGLGIEVATLEALHSGERPVSLPEGDATLGDRLPEAVRRRRGDGAPAVRSARGRAALRAGRARGGRRAPRTG